MNAGKYLRVVTAIVATAGTLAPLSAHAQDDSRRYRTGQIKVGDRILADAVALGKFDTCTVIGTNELTGAYMPGYTNQYEIKCDHNAWVTVAATGDKVTLVSHGAQPVAGASQPGTIRGRAAGGPGVAPQRAGGNAFGTRNPRSCPAVTHRPSTTEAAMLVACAREDQSRTHEEYLVNDVRVGSMQDSRYNPYTQTGFTNMDTTVNPVAIRGSLNAWSCHEQDSASMMAKYSNVGQNCTSWSEPQAAGYCWKQRTGAWQCVMNDTKSGFVNKQDNIPPPRI